MRDGWRDAQAGAGERESYFLDVLCGGKQALACNGKEAAESRMGMAVKLPRRAGALDGSLCGVVDALGPRGKPMGIDAFARMAQT